MKLHLPSALRKALLLALAAVSATLGIQSATASLIFDGVGIQTYADFGQNCGRYVAGEVNDMLKAIRREEGGIVIRYEGGAWKNATYTISLDQGMIDFSSASTNPVDTAVGYGFLATVAHNGVLSPTYSGLEVGDQNAIRYNSIDFRRGSPFHLESNTDYKMARLNKLVTDVQPSEFYSGADPSSLNGKYLYRTGSGAVDLGWVDENGNWSDTQSMDLPYSFATGGIVTIEWAEGTHKDATDGNFGIFHHFNNNIYTEITGRDFRTKEPIDTPNPLPYRVRSGDSGSPTWVYNEEAGAYQYISSGQSGATYFSQDRGDLKWSEYTKTRFNVTANLGSGDHTVTINPVTRTGETISGEGEGVEVSTTLHYGSMQFTDASGTLQTKEFVGIEKGKHTWLDLSPVKDQVNWFHYGDEYFNVSKYSTDDKEFCFADMFKTNTLAFEAGDNGTYNIVLEDNVDLGVGFVQFSKGENFEGQANFSLKSNDFVLDSAGFAIDKDVTLELDMKAPEKRMVEWRKAGAGNLTITGTGDTNALLNVGGSGTVTLEREKGYAAYNVLASSGSTLVIKDLKQVYRDVTLGAGGATLDLNGNNFTWDNSFQQDPEQSAQDFKSLHLLMEKDIVTNRANTAVTITITDPGEEAFVGAFRDTEQGAINVVYDVPFGDEDHPRTWVMNTVFTNLQNNEGSSFTVNRGGVVLQGINTVHGKQMLGRRPNDAALNFDWHYADAKMDVVINDDAEFTLGSHARLQGNVTVQNGGVFNMTEYTTHQYERIEGGIIEQDTYKFRDYFGLHGDVNLAGSDATFNVKFNPQHHYQDTDSESVYNGKITGSGSMVVDTAGGSLKLTNAGNDFTGTKVLAGGTLVAKSTSALGNTTENKWIIQERGVLVVENSGLGDILPKIAGEYEEEVFWEMEKMYSNGVLALTQNENGAAPNLNDYQQLIIGAVGDIQFGQKGTQQKLSTNDNNEWHLGGGGGNLVVNYVLDNEDGVLVLGNQYTTGTVTLTNTANSFSRIELKGGVTLAYEQGALGGAALSLNYGNRILGNNQLLTQLTEESKGVVLIDNMSDETLDLSTHGDLSLAADKKTTFTGTINLGDNTTYHFGGGAGHLILDTELTDGPGEISRNVVVDGQCYTPAYSDIEDFASAGAVEMTKVLKTTGDVTVQGFDISRIQDDDPMTYAFEHFSTATLQLGVDNALVNVSTVIVKDGGFIDLNGTTQTLHSFITDAHDAIYEQYGVADSSETQMGELVLDVKHGEEDTRWSTITGNLAVFNLTKTGDGTLSLQCVNESSLFTIEQGSVVIFSHQSLNEKAKGKTLVKNEGTVLDISQLQVALSDKTIILEDGGSLKVGTKAVSGSIFANKGTGIIDASGGTATLNATIGAEADSTLVLRNGSFTLSTAQNNAEGGIIDLQGSTLSLSNTEGVSIGGTLKVSNSATLNSTVAGVTQQLDVLDVAVDKKLTIGGNNKAVQWKVNALDGSGTVEMQAGSTASTLRLEGEGSFTGTLRSQGGVAGTPSLVLAHDLAAQHATIDLQGNASMEVAATNAQIAGLTGTAGSKVYASAAGTTLTTNGSGNCTYSGTIGDSTAMNIVMDGTGSQTYTGMVKANDVSAMQGTLNLQGNVTIAGDVTVARGATLSTNSPITIGEGQYLCSTGAGEGTGSVNSAVTFSGGGLRFDAAGLKADTAALQFNGSVTAAGNVTVDFTNTSFLTAGSTLSLTGGYDWNLNNLTATGLDYLDATFSMTGNNILQVSFAQTTGNRIWDGTNSQHTWSNSAFGQGSVPGNEDTAVFNDSAQSKDVQVSGDVTAKALLFDNSEDYTVSTTGDSTLSAQEVSLKGTGDVTLGGGVGITQTVNIGDGSTLVLENTDTLGENVKVDGAGTLAINSDEPANLGGKVAHIGCVEVRGGALEVGQTLAADDLAVCEDAVLLSSTGSILGGNATVHSAGYVEIDITSGSQDLNNAIAAGKDGVAGTFAKEGSGTLNVKKSLVADTVVVNGGRLDVSDTAMLPGFLTTTEQVVVNAGSSAYIGHNAYTIGLSQIGTDFVVDGGTLELALAQHVNALVTGDVTINRGTLNKKDGGLIFTGTTTLGEHSGDAVTLTGNWGKGGMVFDGLVEGEGKVKLTKGNAVEKYTFNHADNTFSGEIEATAGTQLVAGNKTALAKASVINLNGGSLVLAADEVDVKTLNATNGTLELGTAGGRASATLNVTEGGSFNGSVEGNVSIAKSGSGELRLAGNFDKFSGTLSVGGGTVTLDAATFANPETIVSAGTLSLTTIVDSFSGTLAVNSGATLKLAEMGEQAVSVGGLTLASGSTLDVSALNISAQQKAPITLMAGGSIVVQDEIHVNFGSGTPDYYALSVVGNNLMLTFVPPAQDLIWDGDANSNWSNSQDDTNWHTAAEPETHVAFAKDANVTFESGTRTVSLTDNIIAGNMKLAVGADVTISNAGNYTQEFINVTIEDGAKLRFGGNGSTTVKGSLALDGSVTNDGNLTIAEGTVASGATGVLAGSGTTELTGTIANEGTVVLDEANLKGSDNAAITGDVVINGGTLSGTMELGSKGSKVAVANVFTLDDAANDTIYTIKGDLVLDALEASEITYIGAAWDDEHNGFMAYAAVQACTEPTDKFTLADGACATYKGVSGIFEDGLFTCEDFSTFHVNTGEKRMETYSYAVGIAGGVGRGDDFKNVRLAAGTGFELDGSEGAALDKVTVVKGEAPAELAVSNAASIDSVEMGSDLTITGGASLRIGSVQAGASETLTVNGPTVTVAGDMDNFHGSVDVESGVLNIMNAVSVNVQDVTIGTNATLGVYSNATFAEADEGTLTIKDTQRLTAGKDATLNANLVMESGSTLDVSATGGTGLQMGSEVTLNMGVNLSTADLANVMGLMQGESYILFNGVDFLTLGQTTYTEAITPETKVDAAEWFNGLAAESYYVVYDGSNVGHVAIFSATPEPTTSTLSLLALAALAARRRRK